MDVLAAHCNSIFEWHGSLFLAMFIAGFMGGFTHCLGMCSTFSICSNSCESSCGKKKSLQRYGITYHLGRATTYGALGFLSALLSKQIAASHIWPLISASMLVIAGIMFILSSLPECKHFIIKFSGNLTYTKGVLLGFMPCGLIYAALMMAATTANPVGGMVAMWLFVLGTIPALSIANIGMRILADKYQNIMQKITKAVMAINGITLFLMAAKVMR